jgi:hypothetical protein
MENLTFELQGAVKGAGAFGDDKFHSGLLSFSKAGVTTSMTTSKPTLVELSNIGGLVLSSREGNPMFSCVSVPKRFFSFSFFSFFFFPRLLEDQAPR